MSDKNIEDKQIPIKSLSLKPNSTSFGNLNGFNLESRNSDDSIIKNPFSSSSLNSLFKESMLFAKQKKSLRDSLYRKSFIMENDRENSLNLNEDNIEFVNFIYDRLKSFKSNFATYLSEIQESISSNLQDYIIFIEKYIENNEQKIRKIARGKSTDQAFINYADRNIFKQIDLILEILDNLFDSIKDNILLLSKFLEEKNLIFEKNPLEKYININSKLILDSFILSKIDFQKLNLSNLIDNEALNEICKNYFSKKQNNTCSYLEIEKKNDEFFKIESDFMRDNFKNLHKLKLKKIEPNQNSIYNYLTQNLVNNIESLCIDKCQECGLTIFPNCPNLFKFNIKNTQIKKMFLGEKLVFHHLQQIKFKNCKLNDELFKEFLKLLIRNPQIKDNLEVLDLSENLFTSINLKDYIEENGQFNKLKYFNLSRNNIYNFVSDNYRILKGLQVLDLTDNNISTSILFEGILDRIKIQKFLVLLCVNLFVSNNSENCEIYKKYLYENLEQCEYQVPSLVFSLLLNKSNADSLQNLKLSPSIKLSLKILNLSYCGLTSQIVINFLQGNFGMLSLKKLNLSYNFLNNEIFDLFKVKSKDENGNEVKEEKCLFEKLLKIDFSFNEDISCGSMNDLKIFYTFISETPSLRKIKLQGTKFESDYYSIANENHNEVIKIQSEIPNKDLKIFFQLKFLNNRINSFFGKCLVFKNKTI
jgi:hypothetical protein